MSQTNSNLQTKKTTVYIFIIISVSLILAYALMTFISNNLEEWIYDVREPGNAIFPYEPDLNENIFEDEEYLELERLINFADDKTGVTVSIDDTNYSEYGDVVVFMYEFITSIINGDTEFYNNCFNKLYIDAEGKQYPFTMQKLYDITFCLIDKGTDTASNKQYAKVWLDYKIFKNNVTFRTDIGSDVCRRQYLTLVLEDDKYKIQAINTQIVEPVKTINIGRSIALIAGIILYIGLTVGAIVVVIKYKGKKGNNKEPEKSYTSN